MRKGVIYKMVFPNGETYIGKTTNLSKRIRPYKRCDPNNQHLLDAALLKYGFHSCILEIVENDVLEADLNEREIYWIEFYQTMLSKYPKNNGLNICAGGAGSLERKDSPDRVEQKRQWMLKNKIYLLSREMSEEEKIKLSQRMKGHKYRLGSTWSEEQRIKFSEYAKNHDFRHSLGRKQLPEEKEKQIEAQKILILNMQTGIYYHGYEEAANSVGLRMETFKTYINKPPKKWSPANNFVKLSAKKRNLISSRQSKP